MRGYRRWPLGPTTIRRRLMLGSAAAVAVAIGLASTVTFAVISGKLRDQVDASLRETVNQLAVVELLRADGREAALSSPAGADLELVRKKLVPALSDTTRYVQLLVADGSVIAPATAVARLPVRGRDVRLAHRGGEAFFSDVTVDGAPVRMLSLALDRGYAVQVGRPVGEVDETIAGMAWVLAAASAGGIALAAALGLLLTRATLRPVSELTDTAAHVMRTGDLSRRIESFGADELSRLAETFNSMLVELERSMRSQRRLVADASHELRTPLTSLRANLELLARAQDLSPGRRGRLLSHAVAQVEELGGLVADLLELAREGPTLETLEDVRLDLLVADAVERARRRHPERAFALDLSPTVLEAAPARLDRAVTNLLDNAQKWSPAGATIEVRVAGRALVVRDHGPGIAPEDLPHVFDRFYRAPTARGMPGSGLGLAIVRAVAESQGGYVEAANAPGGGAVLRVAFPKP